MTRQLTIRMILEVEIQYQVATLEHVDSAFAFSEQRYGSGLSEVEKIMALWKVRWQKEALSHYFKTGWSFVAVESGRIVGYFMAQPFLYFRGQTQTVWVEHLEAESSEVKTTLIEIAVKVAREKNIQRVLFATDLRDELAVWKAQLLDDRIFEVKTTKG